MIPWLDPFTLDFPPADSALEDPNGLLAAGGDLSPERLVQAYSQGIFPWFDDDQPILWWSPDPRAVLLPGQLHLSRSLRKSLRQSDLRLSMDTAFSEVISACSQPRQYASGTWITDEMISAYTKLHKRGVAHSVEAWHRDELVGGLYGLALGRGFFGESMFSRHTDSSKLCFAWLVHQLEKWGYDFIDCQVPNPHLSSLGVRDMDRDEFLQRLQAAIRKPGHGIPWVFDVEANEIAGRDKQ